MKKIIIIFLISAGAIVVFLVFFRVINKVIQLNKKGEEQVFNVGVIKLKKQTVDKIIRLQGTIEGDPQVTVYANTIGKLSKICVNEGDYVLKDQPLVYLNRDIPGADFMWAPVKAPINGIVTKLYAIDIGSLFTDGSYLTAASPVAEVTNADKLKIIINLGEDDLVDIKVGQQTLIIPLTKKVKGIEGLVFSVTPFIDKNILSGTVIIKADNKEKNLMLGMTANVEIKIGKIDGYFIPESAVLMGEDKIYVYLSVKGFAKMLEVQKGYSRDGIMQITGDFSEGDDIIKEGNFKLYDGAKIKVLE